MVNTYMLFKHLTTWRDINDIYRMILRGIIVFCFTTTSISAAAEMPAQRASLRSDFDGITSAPPDKIDWEKKAEFGSDGNVTVFVDGDGTPTEIYVVGVARISTTLDAFEAEKDAREDAEFNAKAAFALWMSEHLTIENVFDKKVVVIKKNGKRQKESIVISKRHAEQMASAAWRGMSIFWQKRSNDRYYAVWRWSAVGQKLANMLKNFSEESDHALPRRSNKPFPGITKDMSERRNFAADPSESDVMIREANILPEFKKLLMSAPILLTSTGCRAFKNNEDEIILISVGRCAIKGDSAEDRIRSERIAEQMAYAEISKYRGVEVVYSASMEQTMSRDINQKSMYAKHKTQTITLRSAGYIRGLPTVGTWISNDGKFFFLAKGIYLNKEDFDE